MDGAKSQPQTSDKAIEISRLEYQEKYARELRLRRRLERDMRVFLQKLTQAQEETEAIRNEMTERDNNHESANESLQNELLELQEGLRDKDRLNKALVQELVEAAESLQLAEKTHKVRAIGVTLW